MAPVRGDQPEQQELAEIAQEYQAMQDESLEEDVLH